jgi:hypothetical protein
MENSKEEIFKEKLNKFVAYAGIFVALLLFPKVFAKLFAMGDLRGKEIAWLYVLFIVLLSISIYIFIRRKKINVSRPLIFFGLLLLVGIELIVRCYCHFFIGKERVDLLRQESNWTYPENTAYVGHPFLQFVGRPNTLLHGSKALTGSTPFNNFGFTGADFHYDKPDHFIRIACVGESTTADGWPGFLENYLNSHRTNPYVRYEVMNFAHAFWNSAHGTVNLLLNIIDFKPDYVIIHNGWNELHEREFDPSVFRGDYFHDLKPFSLPEIYDRYPIRMSVIYRLIKFKYDQAPRWMSMKFENLNELRPFRRNIETMIENSLMHHSKVIVTTIPHSTDNTISLWYGVKSLDQCNSISRELAQQHKSDSVLFVDLDNLITGKQNKIFTDLAHVNDDGRFLKAQYIGEKILKDTKQKERFLSSLPYLSSDHDNDFRFYQDRIKNNPNWLGEVSKKAEAKKVSVDSMMAMDINWMIDDEQKKISSAQVNTGETTASENLSARESVIQQNMHRIIADRAWYKSVSEKAKKNDVRIEEMLRMDAEYMLMQDSIKKTTK